MTVYDDDAGGLHAKLAVYDSAYVDSVFSGLQTQSSFAVAARRRERA